MCVLCVCVDWRGDKIKRHLSFVSEAPFAAKMVPPSSQAAAELGEVCVWCNTAPLCLYEALHVFHHIPAILIPSSVSLSKTVTQSLPRSLSLSICQSAVSHSLIQSVPRLLSPSVSRSFTHSIPLALFAHLTSRSLTHLHSPHPPIHHSTLLSCRFLPVSSRLWSAILLTRGTFHSLEAPRVLCFVACSSSLYFKPLQCFIPLGLEQFI